VVGVKAEKHNLWAPELTLTFPNPNQGRFTNLLVVTAVMTSRKRIILIRHAQSEENVKVYRICEGLIDVKRGNFGAFSQVFAGAWSLLDSTLDSPLSELGARQVADMRLILRSVRFWDALKPTDLILHSPLQRARDTLYGTLPHPSARGNMVVEEVNELSEATPYEHVISGSLVARIEAFEERLMSAAYDKHSTIVVCGHSQYFKKMLKAKARMNNVDVWEVEFLYDTEGRKDCTWGEARLLHRTALSGSHPWDLLMGNLSEDEQKNLDDAKGEVVHNTGGDDDDAVVNDLQTDGLVHVTKVCRICTMSEEEMPESKLIRPCNCKGTQEFVHIECLNRWRATSDHASETCSVCKYRYVVEKGALARLLLSELGAIVITVALVLVLCLILGWTSVTFLTTSLSLSRKVGSFAKFGGLRWWEQCSPGSQLMFKRWLTHVNENRSSFTLVEYVSHLMYGYGGMFINTKAMCNKTLSYLMEIMTEGACILTTLQLALFVLKNSQIVIENAPNDRPSVQEARYKLLNVAVLAAPLLDGHDGARAANLRLVFIIGFLLVLKSLGSDLREKGRTLATSLGEVILEREN
jgi:phosphohistidine phosphatase SixA